MSDIMTPMPIGQLLDWVMTEKKEKGTVFGVYRPYKPLEEYNRKLFDRMLETPIGPAAGPHTQLAQNIVAAYYAGSRFFELKTVQIMDGAELAACVKKPCIRAQDECYNVEWSTELYVPQAMQEYIKAWFMLKVMAKEFGLGSMDGFQFNISVGYDLDGIKSEKIDTFIEGMKDAQNTEIFKTCKEFLLSHADMFEHVTREDIESISSEICNSATISTLHGCPPQEIEKIADYLIDVKGFHTFVKCNPTLLGYEYARKTMDEMGYDYVAFGDFHFLDDLQYEDAVPMFKRLMVKCEEKGLQFGVKITNTFPVDIKQNELAGEEMYMSGKALYPLSLSVAARLAKDFNGKLRISYSGGADYLNIDSIIEAGIWPVTFATTLLKPGGYQRIKQMAEKVQDVNLKFSGIDKDRVSALLEEVIKDPYYRKPVKPLPVIKMNEEVPLVNCFKAPCKDGCPIHQDITQYIELAQKGDYEEALRVILEKNPLPFITGTICPHNCMNQCVRKFYEESVNIRGAKLISATHGYEAVLADMKAADHTNGKKAAVVGGGPAGVAAAHFLARGGADVCIFEKRKNLGGLVRHIIPDFRISTDSIDKDIELMKAQGVTVKLETEVKNIQELKAAGFDNIVLAIGAGEAGTLELESGDTMNALHFLEKFKKNRGNLSLGKNVVVIGGGNTAMDTARAAKRIKGVETVSLVYRRTKQYMPAQEEELEMALEDGVEFRELLAPKKLSDGQLKCQVMRLGDYDSDGRRGIKETDETVLVPADTVIVAVGEKVSKDFLKANKLELNPRGKAQVNEQTLESSVAGVYVIGDGLYGPGTVVEGIRDAQKAASSILCRNVKDARASEETEKYFEKRGLLKRLDESKEVDDRCLGCASVCLNCAEVCPNRANVAVAVPGLRQRQIIHVDSMCNECGNCITFCPYSSAPYLDKFTLFSNEKDMENSKNQGFTVLDEKNITCKVRYLGNSFIWKKGDQVNMPKELALTMETVCKDYRYLWC